MALAAQTEVPAALAKSKVEIELRPPSPPSQPQQRLQLLQLLQSPPPPPPPPPPAPRPTRAPLTRPLLPDPSQYPHLKPLSKSPSPPHPLPSSIQLHHQHPHPHQNWRVKASIFLVVLLGLSLLSFGVYYVLETKAEIDLLKYQLNTSMTLMEGMQSQLVDLHTRLDESPTGQWARSLAVLTERFDRLARQLPSINENIMTLQRQRQNEANVEDTFAAILREFTGL